MPQSTVPYEPAHSDRAVSVFGQVAALTRDQKEHLLVLLQEDLDGGPYIGDPPEPDAEAVDVVREEWKDEIARRIDDMVAGRVQRIDAQGSAARLVQKYEQKSRP